MVTVTSSSASSDVQSNYKFETGFKNSMERRISKESEFETCNIWQFSLPWVGSKLSCVIRQSLIAGIMRQCFRLKVSELDSDIAWQRAVSDPVYETAAKAPRIMYGLSCYSVKFQVIIDLTLAFSPFASLSLSHSLFYFAHSDRFIHNTTVPFALLEFEETVTLQELDELAVQSGAKLLCYICHTHFNVNEAVA
jgi:hypothetical protein